MFPILQRLKERKLVQWTLAYSAGGFVVLQLIETLATPLGLSPGVQLGLVSIVFVGLPVALVAAWYHDTESDTGSIAVEPRHAGATGATEAGKSIVVLPFENLSPDPDDAYFSDGLTDEVISDLSKLGGLRVISRHSAMRLKGTTKDAPSIARDLGVTHVVTGSVRRAGDALRITTELAEGATNRLVWSEKYSGTMADVFDLQETLARQIVDALEVVVTAKEGERLAARPIVDVKVYERYLMAREELLRFTAENFARAEELLSLSLADAPDNALLLATRAFLLVISQANSLAPAPGWMEEAERLARRALELDPECAVAHEALAISSGYLAGDVADGIRGMRRAHELEPGNSGPLGWLADLHSYVGQADLAIEAGQQGMALDPWSPIALHKLGTAYMWAGDAEGFNDATERLVSRHGGQSIPDWHHAIYFLARQGRVQEMRLLVDRWRPKLPEDPYWVSAAFLERALSGDRDGALAVYTPGFDAWTRRAGISSWIMSGGYALLGDLDHALELMTLAVDLGFINYPFLAEHDVFLKPLWEEPGGRALLARIKGEWKAFDVAGLSVGHA